MARPLRIHVPGAPYHLMSRGNAKQCIFEDDRDHLAFLELLGELLPRFAMTCIAYCLHWNHFHLIVIPGPHTVSRLMQDLNSRYCQGFNRRHNRSGHVVGERFKGPIIDSDSYLLTALRYVVVNPVDSGRVTHPGQWRWSSYRATAGLEACPPWLSLDRVWPVFDTSDPAAGRERFVAFVESHAGDGQLTNLEAALYFGGRDLGRQLDPMLEPHRTNATFTYAHRFATRPPLNEILDVPDRRPALEEAVRVAFCQHAYKLREIGEMVGRPAATIWSWIQRAEARRDPAREPRSTPRTRNRGQSSIFE